jgi:NAD(P)-dependent dehydrogenase (short-subunit alcohol dehydrogenase family)
MTKHFPKPPFKAQPQSIPGRSDKMEPKPDYGETTYRGSNRLKDKKAVITGADSGIGRAVALAFAREGADVLVSYLDEHDDANETKRLVEEAGRKCVLVPGDVSTSDHCRKIVKRAVDEFGRIDVLVNNAAHQMSFNAIEEISDEEWEKTLSTNISAMFYIVKSAVTHMPEGSSIINTASVNADAPSPHLLAYATTKGAIQNFTGGLAQLLAEKGIRANAVAPGPVWTELCRKIGDGVNQAADLISATASIPSLNFIPLTTFGNWF